MPPESSVRAVVVVEVLPLPELLVEQGRVIDDHPVQHPVEFFLVDPVGPLQLAVRPRGAGLDVDVLDPPVQDVLVESRLELRPVVGLDGLHPEGQPEGCIYWDPAADLVLQAGGPNSRVGAGPSTGMTSRLTRLAPVGDSRVQA